MASVVEIKFSSKKDDVTKIAHDDIMEWLAAVGEDAAHTAAEKAPVGTPESTGIPHYIGGTLKNSISWATQRAQGGNSTPKGRPERQTVYIGTNIEYAKWHEFGTGKYNPEGRKTPWAYKDKDGKWHYTHGVPAKHFIQFGTVAHANEYGRLLEQIMKQ